MDPINAGEQITISGGQQYRYIEAFETKHSRYQNSLGFSVVEMRRRLNPQCQLSEEYQINHDAHESGKDPITQYYPQKLFSYSGDCIPFDPDLVRGTEILCHDATFFDTRDRVKFTHASLFEAIRVATAAGVKRELYAMHVSPRYKKALERFQREVDDLNTDFKIRIVPPGKICRYD